MYTTFIITSAFRHVSTLEYSLRLDGRSLSTEEVDISSVWLLFIVVSGRCLQLHNPTVKILVSCVLCNCRIFYMAFAAFEHDHQPLRLELGCVPRPFDLESMSMFGHKFQMDMMLEIRNIFNPGIVWLSTRRYSMVLLDLCNYVLYSLMKDRRYLSPSFWSSATKH